MKKNWFLIFLFFLFLVPNEVFATETTKKMYIRMNILEDGSVKVEEVAELSGEYNGRWREIAFKNLTAREFSGSTEDFKGSSIYNASAITDIQVGEVPLHITKNSFDQCEKKYQRVYSGSSGQYGVYEESDTNNSVSLKIYNPSSRNKSFYLSYVLHDVVVVHNDVAEIAWNILGDSYQENISDLKVWVHLPKKDPTLRVWLKGSEKTLNGEIRKKKDQTAYIYYDFLGAYNPISVRMMFDKSITPRATKYSGINGKEKILAVEKEAAEEANRVREQIKRQNFIIISISVFWYFLTIAAIVYFVISKKKNKKTTFEQDYYRDFPGDYGPEILEYLLKKNVTELGMSASILNIIEKKVFKVEENTEKEKDYHLILVDKEMKNLTEQEKLLCDLFINQIGDGTKVSMSEVRKYGKSRINGQKLLEQYDIWRKNAISEGQKKEFFTGTHPSQIFCLFLGVCSFIILFLNIAYETNFVLGYFSIFIGFLVGIYPLSYSFKSEKGALEYAQWMAFKKFIQDFGLLDEKELPEIKLWGKYLVYATVLGCAKEVEKAMKTRFDQLTAENNGTYLYGGYYYHDLDWYITAGIYHSIHSSVTNSISSSRASIASSSSSSSGGFGGGSSFGGGSFGGGGGGGRF